jgi:putative RecB family exonuclease
MDMGNGFYEVHDYKTNMTLARQEDLDKDRQLAMYSLWVREQFKDFKKVRLVWHFVAFDKEMESFRTKEQLEELRAQVLEDIHEIETAQDFPAKVSRLCNWCLYKGICPEWKHETQIEDKPVNEFMDDPGVKLVDEYVKVKAELDAQKKEAEAKLDKLKEALIAFSEREGVATVFGSEKKVSVKKYESFKFPPKGSGERSALVAFLKDIDRLNDLSELDVRNLANILKGREWDDSKLSKLNEFATKEMSYRLSIAKHERPKE